MAESWAVTVEVTWHPILTFERKRLDLLDWIDTHVDYIGFRRREDAVGIRISKDLRLTFRLSRATIEARDRETLREAAPLLKGALEIFQPKHPGIAVIQSFWSSQDLEADYDATRRKLADMASLGLVSPFKAVDTSVLVDVESPLAEIQCEYGIVTADELRLRLARPNVSISRTADEIGNLSPKAGDKYPEVALFARVWWVPLRHGPLTSELDLLDTADKGIEEAGQLVTRLVEALGTQGG